MENVVFYRIPFTFGHLFVAFGNIFLNFRSHWRFTLGLASWGSQLLSLLWRHQGSIAWWSELPVWCVTRRLHRRRRSPSWSCWPGTKVLKILFKKHQIPDTFFHWMCVYRTPPTFPKGFRGPVTLDPLTSVPAGGTGHLEQTNSLGNPIRIPRLRIPRMLF